MLLRGEPGGGYETGMIEVTVHMSQIVFGTSVLV
jgi:hypothetical protein